MKKAALTFGLFSLVMVATSFANPTNISSDSYDFGNVAITNQAQDTDGGQVQGPNGKRKQDFQASNNTQVSFNQSEGFRQDRQSVGIAKKMD
nr:hypothetical protein [Flavobacterium sp. ASV13]